MDGGNPLPALEIIAYSMAVIFYAVGIAYYLKSIFRP
jgi:hypothetical protein